jgi:hypothetical protein
MAVELSRFEGLPAATAHHLIAAYGTTTEEFWTWLERISVMIFART